MTLKRSLNGEDRVDMSKALDRHKIRLNELDAHLSEIRKQRLSKLQKIYEEEALKEQRYFFLTKGTSK